MVMGKTPEEQCAVSTVILNNEPLVCLMFEGEEMVCLAQLSNTLLKDYSYNEIHNRYYTASIYFSVILLLRPID